MFKHVSRFLHTLFALALLTTCSQARAVDYLVTYEPGAARPQAMAPYTSRAISRNVELVSVASGQAAQFERSMRGNVRSIERDRLIPLASVPNDPRYDSQWHLPKIGMPFYGGGTGIKTAVIDSGFRADHPDLGYSYLYNAVDGTSDVTVPNDHGVSTSGVIGAVTGNGVGVAGVASGVDLMGIQISTREDGAAYLSDIMKGYQNAIDNGARVTSISYGGLTTSPTVYHAAEDFSLMFNGHTIVSAGNSGNDISHFNSPFMLVVGASDANDRKTSWSTYGTQVDLVAPGAGIWTTSEGGYKSVSGTSFSAPMVAGVVSLLLAENPDYTAPEMQQLLCASAVDIGAAGLDPQTGCGRLDAGAAFAALGDGGAVPVPAALWLFGSGLIGLVGVARRHSA